jgi:hypothetical protein
LVAVIISVIALIFIIMATSGSIAAARCAADLRGRTTFVDKSIVTGKRWTGGRRGGGWSYLIQFGKSEYHVPKETYDRIETGNEMDLRFTIRSKELLSMKNSAGDDFPVL